MGEAEYGRGSIGEAAQSGEEEQPFVQQILLVP